MPLFKIMYFGQKNIVVTGGGSDPDQDVVGFGHQVAKDLYDKGANVVILGRRTDRLKNAALRITGLEEPSDCFSYHECDVTDEEKVREVFDIIKKTHGRIFGLVNNAAYNVRNPLADAQISDIRRIIDANLIGPMICSKFALKQMLEAGEGSIVNISSIAAKNIPLSNMPAYNASKSGIEAVSASIVKDYGSRGIRSNIVRPGYSRTPLTDNFFKQNPDKLKALMAQQPLGGLVTPQEVSRGVLHFLNPDCKETGKTLEISNGHIAG